MQMQKIFTFLVIAFCFTLKAGDLERVAIFPFKTNGLHFGNSFVFVELLRKEISKSKQYEIMEYAIMKKMLSYHGYKGDILCYNDECAFVMGEFYRLKRLYREL